MNFPDIAAAAHRPHEAMVYDGRTFYAPGRRGELVPMNEASVRRYLVGQGYVKSKDVDEVSPALTEIQIENYALRVGPMAGYAKGWQDVPDGRVYVTSEIRPVIPADVPCGMLLRLIEEMLGEEQAGWFLRWLAIGHRSLASMRYRPGQALALVGPPASGKSLLSGIIVELFGGRVAHPFSSWSNGSQFNGHLVGAECLVIDDESPSRDMRARRNLATSIKSCLFSDTVGIEGKNKTPFTCRPWWRVIICCNSEPENVMVLPPMEDSISDKIALLLVRTPNFPAGIEGDTGREAFRRRISGELPGLLRHALALPLEPFDMDTRTGIRAYHNSEILGMLRELSKEALLESLLAGAADELEPEWTGTAPELFQRLTGPDVFPSTREQARRLMDSPAVAGYLLRDLARSRPGMVQAVGESRGLTRWRIRPGAVKT